MPTILPLGDAAVLVRFGDSLSEAANRQAIAFAARLDADMPEGVELRLRIGERPVAPIGNSWSIPVVFDGEDLMEVCGRLKLAPGAFVVKHNGTPLRVLATGFAPGFVYCGFHSPAMVVPRREQVRPMVPAGTVLFAAGQTAITATPIRTGWHVIGRTIFQNFDPDETPPTAFAPGDTVEFTVAM